jgi:phage replication-related protein YjqB (UPF0714/DUF867 family)
MGFPWKLKKSALRRAPFSIQLICYSGFCQQENDKPSAIGSDPLMDRYQNFKDLAAGETAFQIDCCDRGSDVTILAPHGGNIEPHTTEIGTLIAGSDYNLFCFNGHKEECNRDLHITSHLFDHEQALSLVSTASFVIAVHGCAIATPLVYLGGLDTRLIGLISHHMQLNRITTYSDSPRYAGTHSLNICNRGYRRQGVQLEFSRGIRDSREARDRSAAAVRSAISEIKSRERQGSYFSPRR